MVEQHWPKIIGITGFAGVGKSTFAACVRELGYGRGSFAEPMKNFVCDVFGWDRKRVFGPSEERERPDPDWDGLTARRALQTLGTEWGRAMHPDVWVRYAIRKARDRRVVFEDVRFANEARCILDAGGIVIRVRRPSVEPSFWSRRIPGALHASEREILSLPVTSEWDGDSQGRPDVDKVHAFLEMHVDRMFGRPHDRIPVRLRNADGAQVAENASGRRHRVPRTGGNA